ncbi:MAG: type IV secretion system DNA-binding domain-containing protein [Rhizobiaceae bacterium]
MQPKQQAASLLGYAHHRQGKRPFGIRADDRMLHAYIIGQTGTGKSTLLANMIAQDMARQQGLCLIDPHGDLAESLLDHLGPDGIYWDVADAASPYGYNPLTHVTAGHRPMVASGLIDALKKQWADAWGVRMEHLLRYAILALLEQPQADLRDIVRLFIDRKFRLETQARVTDAQTKQFWEREFPAMNYKTAIDGVAPIANKIGAFLAHPVIRRAVTEPAEPLRFRRIMDKGQTLIVNLAKGRIGNDMANLLGGLLVASLANAALSRHDTMETRRRPFFLYVDEFHAFTTLSFANLLSEVRKYGLGVVLAHQYAEQAELPVQQAVFGNVGSLIAFRVGVLDAPLLARQFEPLQPLDLINQKNHEAYARIMVEGHRSRVFSFAGFPPGQRFGESSAA